MFTGIIEELGSLEAREATRFRFRSPGVLDDVVIGASIAVNGCCLTVVEHDGDTWVADVSEETRRRTAFDGLALGAPLNFERSLKLDDRLGGHVVQGHVDGVGVVVRAGEQFAVEVPPALAPFIAEKGSVAVDGVSLTVVDATPTQFSVALIPHTLSVTNLGSLRPGASVNVETDVMAKYARRLLQFATADGVPEN